MAVQQEMAEVYPPDAEELCEFLPETDCGQCGASSCLEFAEAVLSGQCPPAKCQELEGRFRDALSANPSFGPALAAKASDQYERTIQTSGKRGSIFDRRMPLV